MSESELRQAAERLRRTESGERSKIVYGFDGEEMDDFNYRMLENAYTRDWKMLALAYLAEHPADGDEPITVLVPASQVKALQDELAELRADAERYRWLRISGKEQVEVFNRYWEGELDAAIDAARKGGE